MTTLIVDDEPMARRILREELDRIHSVKVIAEATSGEEALTAIEAYKPDLVFLDLQMPVMGGFEVVRRIDHGTHLPVFVIVTAYDQYALDAFEAGAVDYLLKPFGHERLEQAVGRAARIAASKPEVAEQLRRLQEIAEPAQGARIKKIVGRLGEEYVLLKTDEVYAFQAEGDLVWIVTEKKRYLSTEPLRVLQEKLANTSFRRIHRNALVNTDHVRKMSAMTSHRWLITLRNNLEFIVSKRQARTIRELLS